jgi:hypothetical protein
MSENTSGYAPKEDFKELKKDLSDLRKELRLRDAKAQAREERIASEAQARELRLMADAQAHIDRTIETMRDIETSLVNQFINYARNNDERNRLAGVVGSNNSQRLSTLEIRVTELEVKLLRLH